MNLKLTFTIYGIYNILLGLAFVFIPSNVMSGAGITPTTDIIATHQIWGAALIGIGWIAFKLKEADDNKALSSVAKGFIVVAGLPVIVTIYHMMQGFAGPPIYMNIIINGLVAVFVLIKTK